MSNPAGSYDQKMSAIMRGLEAIDEQIRNSGYPGEEGSGIYMLMSELAHQQGITIKPLPPAPKEAEPDEEGETGETESLA